MRSRVYKNLTKKCYSIQQKSKVVDHLSNVLLEDVAYIVSEKTRQQILLKKKKLVHAFAEGNIVNLPPEELDKKTKIRISYNPYLNSSFIETDTGIPVITSDYCLLTPEGVYAIWD